LSVTTSGSGRVVSAPQGIDCGNDCSESLASGTTVTLTATAADGFRFSGWSGACTGSATSCSVTMSTARSVNANFVSMGSQACSLPVAPNTWTDWIDLSQPGTVEFPAGHAGRYEFRGWNGLTSNSTTSYLYEGYRDDHVGGYRGYSIYANAIYAMDLPNKRLRMVTVSNWAKGARTNPVSGLQCHVTYPSADTLATPTPPDRHPYGAFHVTDNGKALLMFGANAHVQYIDRAENMCTASSSPADAWSFDMATRRWEMLARDARCEWCPPNPAGVVPVAGATGGAKVASFPGENAVYAMVTHGSGGSTYVMRYDTATRQWTMLSERSVSPGGLSTISIAADSQRRRLIVEVLTPQNGHAAGFYTFDVDARTWNRLETRGGTEPRTSYSTDRWVVVAYDSKRDLYLVNGLSGLVAYNPTTMVWTPVSSQSFVYQSNLMGLTYDAQCDVLLARTVGKHNVISVYPHRP
jgi:hypothetical protein